MSTILKAVDVKKAYSIDHRQQEVLKGIHLEIQKGDFTVIMGSSGAGKTTLCSLIPRFYDVSSGAIYLDGKDIRKIKLKDLRNQIGIVQQDVYLFVGNIMENIRYGRPDATDEEISKIEDVEKVSPSYEIDGKIDIEEKEIITKLIIPGAIAMIICLIVHPMCMNGEILDWRKLLLFVGIPFGIQKMFLLVVPRNVGTGEMLGLVVLKLMVGSLIGIGVLAWRLLAVAGVLLKNGISGIIWIIKRLKEMVIKNERKATGKIVL